MVRSPALRLALLALLVAVGHLVALEWLARQADKISGLVLMTPPLYTRLLQPAKPPPVPAVAAAPQPRPRAAPAPRPPASSAEELRRQREAEARARREAQEQEARAAQEREQEQARAEAEARGREAAAAREREQAAQLAQAAVSAPTPAASAAPEVDSLARWPTDTLLHYRLTGHFRGPLYGDARVQWQREGDKYQVRLDVRIQVFGTQILTSQGEVTPDGLLPRAYEELRPGKRRFATIGDEVVMLENGRTVPRPPGVQDTASQFVELSHRFATGKELLEVGRSVSLWLARPGGVDQWTYDIVGLDTLRTGGLGPVEAFHLKPRPLSVPRGNITAEMWFAPSLQYLPARIKVLMGDEAYLDLVVDTIQQR